VAADRARYTNASVEHAEIQPRAVKAAIAGDEQAYRALPARWHLRVVPNIVKQLFRRQAQVFGQEFAIASEFGLDVD
jgi:hypothetical protein